MIAEFTLKRSNIHAECVEDGTVVLTGVKDFDLSKTFDCGQCFRFSEIADPEYDAKVRGIAFGKQIEIAQRGESLFLFGTDIDEYRSLWRHFLSLDVNYPKLCDSILKENKDHGAVALAYAPSRGIRILRQDPWETLCTFIISQNNNIPRIKGIVDRLCATLGKAFVGLDGDICHAFPTPEEVIDGGIDHLKKIGTGFRAKYIMDAAERVASRRIDFNYIVDCTNTEECVRHLCEIYGVGVKVASCVLLFAFEKYDAFPQDVWIKRVMDERFGEGFDPSRLGEHRGLVQQWLYFYERFLGGASNGKN